MDAIKKKMQAMKIEKDNAMDRADAAEEKVRQMTEKLERVGYFCPLTPSRPLSHFILFQLEEELRDTQKKMMQTENDLDKVQEDLTAANTKLEEKEKTVQEVSGIFSSFHTHSTTVRLRCQRAAFDGRSLVPIARVCAGAAVADTAADVVVGAPPADQSLSTAVAQMPDSDDRPSS